MIRGLFFFLVPNDKFGMNILCRCRLSACRGAIGATGAAMAQVEDPACGGAHVCYRLRADLSEGSRLCKKSENYGSRNLQVAFLEISRRHKACGNQRSWVFTQSRSFGEVGKKFCVCCVPADKLQNILHGFPVGKAGNRPAKRLVLLQVRAK